MRAPDGDLARLALLAVHGPLQLALVHARASAHAEAARLLVELFARAPARTAPARAQAAAPPRRDVTRGAARACAAFAAAGAFLVDRARGDLLRAPLGHAPLALGALDVLVLAGAL